jgi:hypothetical protein
VFGALVLSKEARVTLLAEPELTRATAARGSGVDVEVVGGGANGQSRVIDEQEGRERQHTRQALRSHLSNVAVLSLQTSEADCEEGEESESREPLMKRFSRAKLGKMCAEVIGTLSFLTATTTVAARGCNTASLHPVMSQLPCYQPPKPALRVIATDFQRGPFLFCYPLMGPTSLACRLRGC